MVYHRYIKKAFVVILAVILAFGVPGPSAFAATKTKTAAVKNKKKSKKSSAKIKASATREQLTNITTDLNVVLIGDSYTTHPVADKSKRVPAYLKKELKLKKSSFKSACRSGAGFTKSGYKSFTRLINGLKADRTVTHVVFVGSLHNDSKSSAAFTTKSCKKINKLLKKKFPNAAVLVASPNWHTRNSIWRLQVQAQSARLKRACASCGWTYLEGMDRILHGHSDYFEKDGHHPNAKGAKAIAKKLAAEIRKAAKRGGYKIGESNVGEGADGALTGTRLALALYLDENSSCETDEEVVDSEKDSSAGPVPDPSEGKTKDEQTVAPDPDGKDAEGDSGQSD